MATIPRSTVPPVLNSFAQRTVLKQSFDINSTQSFVVWNPSPSVKNLLLNGRLDKVYSFGVPDTCYKVELMAMWYPGQSSPCWGLAVRHTEWATHLAELERLQTGHQATWGDVLETFLPDYGGSSSKVEDDDLSVSGLTLGDNANKSQTRALPREGIRALAGILLSLSGIVSSVTVGGDVQV